MTGRTADRDAFLGEHGLQLAPARPIPGAPQTVAGVLDRWVRADPGRPALRDRRVDLTYAELDREATRAANALLELGVRRFDRVAMCLPNTADIVVAFLGAARAGAIWLGVNRRLAPPEQRYLLEDSGARVLLADDGTARAVRERSDTPSSLRAVVGLDEWRGLLGSTAAAPVDVPVDPFDPAGLAYTSGTTGFPKGVLHSQRNMVLPGAVHASTDPRAPLTQGVCLPLTVLNLEILGPTLTFQAGGMLVPVDRVDAPGLAEWIRDLRIQRLYAAPAMADDLITSPDVSPDDLSTLEWMGVGGAATPAGLRERYRERFGRGFTSGYGLTEAPTSVTREPSDGRSVDGASGVAADHLRILVEDDDGRELAPGEEGEICVTGRSRGPWAGVYSPMLGYWNRPEATRETLRDGVLRTGDLGYLDGDGNLFVTGRRADVIIRGGANVYAAEVERVLQMLPAVAEAAVVGRPDERLGEEVVAFVVVEPGAAAAPEQLDRHCRHHLARGKVPVDYRLVGDLPRNAMGKAQKSELRARLDPSST